MDDELGDIHFAFKVAIWQKTFFEEDALDSAKMKGRIDDLSIRR